MILLFKIANIFTFHIPNFLHIFKYEHRSIHFIVNCDVNYIKSQMSYWSLDFDFKHAYVKPLLFKCKVMNEPYNLRNT